MELEAACRADIDRILARCYDNGGDLWATPDRRLLNGSPFSTLECTLYLSELGLGPDEPIIKDLAALIFSVWQQDGRWSFCCSTG